MKPHTVCSGEKFNKLYKDISFVKLTNSNECHNGFRFKDGLNIDTVDFNPIEECRPGGIYFCFREDYERWTKYGCSQMFYIREVSIPDDAQVYCEENKFKADKIILGPRQLLFDSLQFQLTMRTMNFMFANESDCLFALRTHKDYIDLLYFIPRFYETVRIFLLKRLKEDKVEVERMKEIYRIHGHILVRPCDCCR